MGNKYQLTVERLGGFAGFNLPGSHLKSRGELSASELSPADLKSIDALFQIEAEVGAAVTDSFRYRVTRKIGDNIQTIEVPEEKVPLAIRNSVKDTIE